MKNKKRVIRDVNNWSPGDINFENVEGDSMTEQGCSYTVKDLFIRAQGGFDEGLIGGYLDGHDNLDAEDADELARAEIEHKQAFIEAVLHRDQNRIEGEPRIKVKSEKPEEKEDLEEDKVS